MEVYILLEQDFTNLLKRMNKESTAAFITGLEKAETWAFDLLYKRVVPAAIGFMKNKGVSQEEQQDIVQNSVIIMLKKAHNGSLKISSTPEAYFMEVVKREVYKLWEGRGRKEAILAEEGMNAAKSRWEMELTMEIEQLQAGEERWYKLQAAIEALPGTQCGNYIKMHFLEEMSHKELAAMAGVSYDAFRKKFSRCMKELKEIIKKL